MPANETNLEEEIRLLALDTLSAQKWAREGKIEAWVHKYLLSGKGGTTNPEFSAGLKREKRWWNGPVELPLADLSPAVGTAPGMEYVVEKAPWEARIRKLAASFSTPFALPPLIAEYRDGMLSIRDGNTRHSAMHFLGWTTCWVIIWYNSESDYHRHNQSLFPPDKQ
ncbi:MAG: chromosome partitioning protein ParB [Anaerolineales bacterium]|nr:chromosome partitioning protein ParB [Anaerolineales bacterium]